MLQEYDFIITYRKGTENNDADALSRFTYEDSLTKFNAQISLSKELCAHTELLQPPPMEEIRHKSSMILFWRKCCTN